MKLPRFVSMLAFAAPCAFATDFSTWPYATVLKLNTTASGANVSGTVNDFPVLIRLTPANFDFDQTRPDGGDLRFSKNESVTDATELAYQIERWDKANKYAEIWVNVPQILGNNSQQAIKMYWGHANPPTAAPATPVFGSSNGYAAVWHLGEGAGTVANGFKDATSAGNHGTGVNLNGSSTVSAVAGMGTNFDGTQSISMVNGSNLHPSGQLSLELWMNANSQGQYKRLISKAFTSAAYPWNEYDLEFSSASNKFSFVIAVNGQQVSVGSSTATLLGQWYHVTATYDQSNMRIYVNGVLEGTLTQAGALNNYGRPVTLGKYEHDGASNYNGKLDEVRVSTTARSADWVKLAYMNQRQDQKLVEMQGAI